MLKYQCDVCFDKGLVSREEKKQYRENVRNVVEGVCTHAGTKNILSACAAENIKGLEVNILFTEEKRIREINREYRDIDRSTDVLSFPVNDFSFGDGEVSPYNIDEERACLLLGDIVVSVPTMLRQAEEYGHSVQRECAFLICHGLLHLFGYDHETAEDETQMFHFADEILNALHYTRSTAE